VLNSLPGAVPFGLAFDRAGDLVVAEAGTDALATFQVSGSGTLNALDSVGTGAAATCWVVEARGYFYASNAGSATVSPFAVGVGGALTLLGSASTDAGTVDAAASPDGRYLFVQTGHAGIVDEFAVADDGSLSEIGSVTVPNAVGGEGVAVS
jgi:6-phosphogluconolactonase (cycloisomerase 2 family)